MKMKKIFSAMLLVLCLSVSGFVYADNDANADANAVAIGLAAPSNAQSALTYAPVSHVNYEAPHQPVLPVNGFASPVSSPNIFGALDQGPNAQGTGFGVYVEHICAPESVSIETAKRLGQIVEDGDNGNTEIAFQPRLASLLVQKGYEERVPQTVNFVYDTQADFSAKYRCLGVILIQAEEDGDMRFVNEASMIHDLQAFAAEHLIGHRDIVLMTTIGTLANTRHIETSGISGTLSPSISGVSPGIGGGGILSVTGSNAQTDPHTQKGMTVLVLEKLSPSSKEGKTLMSPRQWDANQKAAVMVNVNGSDGSAVHKKAIGATGAIQQ